MTPSEWAAQLQIRNPIVLRMVMYWPTRPVLDDRGREPMNPPSPGWVGFYAPALGGLDQDVTEERAELERRWQRAMAGAPAQVRNEEPTGRIGGTEPDDATVVDRPIRRVTDDAVAKDLRGAGEGADPAADREEPRDAAVDLDSAVQGVGLDRRSPVLANARERTEDAPTITAAHESRQPLDLGKDAIRSVPFGPVEAVLAAGGVAAAVAEEGLAAGAGALGRAIARQFTRKPTPPDRTIVGRPIRVLSESGKGLDPADRGRQLTRAGRALQKHGGRPGSAYPSPKGNPTQLNERGQEILEGILNDSGATVKAGNRFRGFDVIAPNGRGARFDSKGKFMGFLG